MLKSDDSQLISVMRKIICMQKKIPSMSSTSISHIKLLYTAWSMAISIHIISIVSGSCKPGQIHRDSLSWYSPHVAVDIFAEEDDSGDNIVSSQEQLDL